MASKQDGIGQIYRVVIVRTMYVWAEDERDAAKAADHWAAERNPAEESVASVTPATLRRARADDWDNTTPYNCPYNITVAEALKGDRL